MDDNDTTLLYFFKCHFFSFFVSFRPLESQLRIQNRPQQAPSSSGNGGHNSRKDGNNNKNKAKRSTGGK